MGNLDDFLTTAELSNRDFTAERMNVSIVTAVENEAIISEKREQAMVQVQKDNQHKLRIPRRPHWEKGSCLLHENDRLLANLRHCHYHNHYTINDTFNRKLQACCNLPLTFCQL